MSVFAASKIFKGKKLISNDQGQCPPQLIDQDSLRSLINFYFSLKGRAKWTTPENLYRMLESRCSKVHPPSIKMAEASFSDLWDLPEVIADGLKSGLPLGLTFCSLRSGFYYIGSSETSTCGEHFNLIVGIRDNPNFNRL